MRDYKTEPVIWDAVDGCEHEWLTERKPMPNSAGGFSEKQESVSGSHIVNYYDRAVYSNFCSECGAWKGSLGLEPDYNEYIRHLAQIFDEVRRVLRKDGCCFVVIGDTYGGSGTGQKDTGKHGYAPEDMCQMFDRPTLNAISKSLVMISFRFAIEMVNHGWLLRNTIIYHKINVMPQSVKDRFSVDFEYIFYFVKSNETLYWTNEKTLKMVSMHPMGINGIDGEDWEWRECQRCKKPDSEIMAIDEFDDDEGNENIKVEGSSGICKACEGTGKVKHSFWEGHDYYFEQQFEPIANSTVGRGHVDFGGKKGRDYTPDKNDPNYRGGSEQWGRTYDYTKSVLGRNKRTVWSISTESFSGSHFAVFPTALTEIMVRSGCSEFVCKKCGLPREKIFKYTGRDLPKGGGPCRKYRESGLELSPTSTILTKTLKEKVEAGLSECGCDHSDGWDRGICLDPFIGSGTVALVARKLGRDYIGIELSESYVMMAKKRLVELPERIENFDA